MILTFAALLVVALVVSWLLASSISDNNDLGWRTVLPAIMLLIVFAAVGVARWVKLSRLGAMLALSGIALGLPDGAWLTYQFAVGRPATSATAFAASPAIWAAVRRHAAPTDGIANNPLFLQDMTRWPVNISWALLANRRSCFGGNELAVAFAPVSEERRTEINELFTRVFAGTGSAADVTELATNYQCHVVVLTPEDGAFERDPFAASGLYRLAELVPGKWKIYRRIPNAQP